MEPNLINPHSLDQSAVILLVEDNPEDREATLEAFAESGLANPIYACEDGEEALDYLFHRGKFADPASAPRPGIILLDLKMPGTDGYEVLSILKSDEQLKTIPVVVLTSSNEEGDIEKCYRAGANSYIQKPVSLQGYISSIQNLQRYWFKIVLLPKGQGG